MFLSCLEKIWIYLEIFPTFGKQFQISSQFFLNAWKKFPICLEIFPSFGKISYRFEIFSKHSEIISNGFGNFSKLSKKFWNWFGNVSVLEITTVQIWLTLYCKSKFSSRFIK